MTGFIKNITTPIFAWFKEVFFYRRMNSVPGWIVMALIGVWLAYAGHQMGEKIPLMIAGGAVGLLVVLVCLRYPEFSYYSFMYSIIVFSIPGRLLGIGLPMGVLIEGLGYLTAISIMAAQYRNRTDSADFWKTPISLMMLLLFFYLFLEAFNPEIESREGWFNYFRKQIVYLIFYYVSFLMFDSMEKIRRFVKMWIILALIVTAWGIKQQYFGFSKYEDMWVHSDPNITALLFQGGVFRKFSLLPDPASFGVMCASSALFTLILAIRSPIKKTRNWLFVITFLQMAASSYSGTRTCNAMLVAGLLAYIVFTLNEKRTVIVLVSAVVLTVFLLFGPLQNSPIVYRIKTTFEGSKDASAMARDINRKNIQPYIYQRPLGGGLQTCGEEGNRFYPNHRLAGFPPDSGYMKIMLEQGWVGLAINIIFYFIILQRGITGFYDSKKQEIKTLYIALTVCFFFIDCRTVFAAGNCAVPAIFVLPGHLSYFL